jgi:peptidoglycan hydrolase CwlO-like protein
VHVSWSTVISVIGVLGFLIVVAGVLGAAFRTSRNVQSISNYRDAAQSWEARANAQEQELSDQAHQIETCQHKIDLLQQELSDKERQLDSMQEQITQLRELLTGRAAFETLNGKLAEAVQLAADTRRDVHRLLEIETSQETPDGG